MVPRWSRQNYAEPADSPASVIRSRGEGREERADEQGLVPWRNRAEFLLPNKASVVPTSSREPPGLLVGEGAVPQGDKCEQHEHQEALPLPSSAISSAMPARRTRSSLTGIPSGHRDVALGLGVRVDWRTRPVSSRSCRWWPSASWANWRTTAAVATTSG